MARALPSKAPQPNDALEASDTLGVVDSVADLSRSLAEPIAFLLNDRSREGAA
jgi:hypothetical protein